MDQQYIKVFSKKEVLCIFSKDVWSCSMHWYINVFLKRITDVLTFVILKSYIGLLKKSFIPSIKEDVLFMKETLPFQAAV